MHTTGWQEYNVLSTAMARVPQDIKPAQFLALGMTVSFL